MRLTLARETCGSRERFGRNVHARARSHGSLIGGGHLLDMTATHTAPATAGTAQPPRVLILEDEPKLRVLLMRAVAGGGFRADAVERGDEALVRAAAAHPDIALLDVLVPGCSGIEVCRRLRAADPEMAIVMLSARADVQDREDALAAGADDYFVKPFSLGELLDRLRALAGVRAPGARLALPRG
jgi:CheY-like chemotaxis protein